MSTFHSIAGLALSVLMYGVLIFAALEPVSLESGTQVQIAAPAIASNPAAA